MKPHQTATKASREDTAETAAAFGAEGLERGDMFQIWAFRCACATQFISWMYDVDNAASVAKTNGWRYTSKRGWECPEHRIIARKAK